MEENKDYNPSQYEDDDRMEAPKSAKSIRGYQTIIVILAVILAALSILYLISTVSSRRSTICCWSTAIRSRATSRT